MSAIKCHNEELSRAAAKSIVRILKEIWPADKVIVSQDMKHFRIYTDHEQCIPIFTMCDVLECISGRLPFDGFFEVECHTQTPNQHQPEKVVKSITVDVSSMTEAEALVFGSIPKSRINNLVMKYSINRNYPYSAWKNWILRFYGLRHHFN